MAATPANPARITAVVPTYNASAFIADAIASVRVQSRAVHELLVVDDASRDGTADLAESLGARVIRVVNNRGPSHARNLGIAEATGDVVAFLDADDQWLPHHCERVVGALDAEPQVVLAAARVECFGTVSYAPEHAPVPVRVPYDSRVALLRRNVVGQTTAVVRVEELRAVGGYDADLRFAEDYDLWMRLATRGPFLHVPEVTARYRYHDGQATLLQDALIRASWTLRQRHAEELRREGLVGPDEIESALREALEADFRDVWNSEHRPAFVSLAGVVAEWHWAAPVVRRWTLRERIGWRLWHSLRRAKRLLRSVSR